MYATAEHSYRAATELRPVAISRESRQRTATIVSWPHSKIESPRELSFAPGQTIFLAGDDAEFFFEIVTGTVRCCRLTYDGGRQIFRFADEGEMLGLSGEEVHTYSAEAVTEVVVLRHRLLSLDTAMARDQSLRKRVLQSLREELAAVQKQMVLLGRMSADERVASFLMDVSRRSEDSDGRVHLPMTRSDIADYLGLTIETVSRKINGLKRQRVIDLPTPTNIRIIDFGRLADLAEAA